MFSSRLKLTQCISKRWRIWAVFAVFCTFFSSVASSNIGDIKPGTVSDPVLETLLRDPSNKIRYEFKIPRELKSAVKFWLKIYTQYSHNQFVICDSRRLNLIYEVVDFSKLNVSTAGTEADSRSQSLQWAQTRMEKYREALLALARSPKAKTLSDEARVIREKLAKSQMYPGALIELSKSLKVIRGQKERFLEGLAEFETLSPMMEDIFKSVQVPKEIVRLALVESALNPDAISRVGAAGLWQFMPKQGRAYWLIDTRRSLDFRFSPMRSTAAAAALLSWNRQHLGTWPLAITAYNHGMKGLPRMGGKDSRFKKIAYLFDPLNTRSTLGWASRNYYSEFLAALYAETYREYFLGSPHPESSLVKS